MRIGRPKPRRLATLATVVAVAGLVVPSAASAGTKPFSVTVSPSTIAAGAPAQLSATITDRTSQQSLGSANLTVPSGLTVSSVTIPGPATATLSASTIALRNLGLSPGGSATATVNVTSTPCTSGTYTWAAIAKQSNDFNGPPGNDLTLDPATSSLTTTVSGACSLRFTTEPQDARTGQHITGTDFDPTGPAIGVEVVDGSGARVTSSSAAITTGIGTAGGAGTLSGTTTVSAASGLASFGDLSIDAPGTYTLSATSPGITSATSDPFVIQQVAVNCIEDIDCTGSLSNGKLSATATAFANNQVDSGFLQMSLDSGFEPDCAGYTEFSADWATVIGPNRTKDVTFTIAKKVMNASPNNGVSFLQMCVAAPFPFAVRPGTTLQSFDTDDVPGPDTFVGLLPDCGTAPCVESRHKVGSGDGVIEVLAPAGTDDPAYRP